MPFEIYIEVTQHRYRTAYATDVFLELPRELFREMERMLAEKAGTIPDNHTVYEVVYDRIRGKKEKTYIMCSDFKVRFGRTILIKDW